MIHGYSSHFPKSARLNPTRQVKDFWPGEEFSLFPRNSKLLTIESLKKSHHLFVYETFVFPHISRYTKFSFPFRNFGYNFLRISRFSSTFYLPLTSTNSAHLLKYYKRYYGVILNVICTFSFVTEFLYYSED
jgi:hypothetical protein